MNGRESPQGLDSFQSELFSGFVQASGLPKSQRSPQLVTNVAGSTVEHALIESLRHSDSFVFSVAFISRSAIARLKQHFLEFQGTGVVITSDFLMFNKPEIFHELQHLENLKGFRVMRHSSSAFHPKGYVFKREGLLTALVGSSNLTSQALTTNYEWNLKFSASEGSDLALEIERAVSEQIRDSEAITTQWIDDYTSRYEEHMPKRQLGAETSLERQDEVQPNAMQKEALEAISETRARGAKRAIIISATGTGKTILSALDVRSVNPSRMLFVVHREQILDRTVSEYRRALRNRGRTFGKLTGNDKDFDADYLFATVQTLSQEKIFREFSPTDFEYIIVDEAHRIGAESYQRVLDHFRPDFLLGMTATPERMDGFNVFELFDYNVPFEIRLNRALEATMLAPFHYYGIADIEFEDGTSTTDATELKRLLSSERIAHIVKALDMYTQVGIPPRGLIFCSRKDEAHQLAQELNLLSLRGNRLKTRALTGDDPVSYREDCVRDLENGSLDYLLTVDVFNEGIDIPSLNQIVMLRQTQSPIVFVQQLGRGLRISEGKDYLVVIDFIGNYNNNFMIPIALFGDETLNKESLRKKLNETVEAGSLPGLSSVSFDEISRDRVLRSIKQTKLDGLTRLKAALASMRNRVGRAPRLFDFFRFESVDPVLLATKGKHFPDLIQRLLGESHGLSPSESRWLELLSHEVFGLKRLHELILLEELVSKGLFNIQQLQTLFESRGLIVNDAILRTTLDTFLLNGYTQSDLKRYGQPILEQEGHLVRTIPDFQDALRNSLGLSDAIEDLIRTGKVLTASRYKPELLFTPGRQYSREEAAHILGWPRSTYSTIYGVKTDHDLGVCAIFVTLDKAEEVSASTAYKDEILDLSSMRWFTKSNRRMSSKDVRPIVDNSVDIHVFVKKDDAEGSNHYYLGQAKSSGAIETSMPGENRVNLPVVSMILKFSEPIPQGLFDYFSPQLRSRDYG